MSRRACDRFRPSLHAPGPQRCSVRGTLHGRALLIRASVDMGPESARIAGAGHTTAVSVEAFGARPASVGAGTGGQATVRAGNTAAR